MVERIDETRAPGSPRCAPARRTPAWMFAASLLILAGCSHHSNPIQPAVQVRLTGQAVVQADVRDAYGNLLHAATYPAVSGLAVELRTDGVATQTVVTENGAFWFIPRSSGSHAAFALVAGEPVDSTAGVVANGTSASFLRPLFFGTHGPVAVMPNPVGSHADIQFVVQVVDTVAVTITTLTGDPVRTLLTPTILSAGLYGVTWDGNDEHGTPALPGPYWVVVDRRLTGVFLPQNLRSARPLDIPPADSVAPGPQVMTTVVIKT